MAAPARLAAEADRGGGYRSARDAFARGAAAGGAGIVTRVRDKAGRLLVLAVLGIGIAAAWHWRDVFDPAALTVLMARSPAPPLVFLGLHTAASLLFVPRTLLALAAGLVFGMWWGMLWAALGSLLGAVAGFLLARYLGGDVAERAGWRRAAALLTRAGTGGWRMVAILRLVPVIPHSLTNYALGLTGVRLGAYMLGSLLGQLPLTIAYADLGAAGGRALLGGSDWRQAVLWPSAIGLSVLLLSLVFPLALRRLRPAPSVAGS
ncbi:MAG: TVP38/TMEM64 family protein [Alphaproteobacteria bacterium]|nr:TVP38/TMEM64 family protein [Alphaproteobacteria bacterium]